MNTCVIKRMQEAAYNDNTITEKLDIHIGNQIKRLRLKNGVSQVSLSKNLGISVTQIQKYENATNRVSASRLYCLAILLKTSPSYFFDSFVSQNNKLSGLSDNEQEGFLIDTSPEDEQQDLVNSYFAIKDPAKRKWHLDHIKQDSDN